MSEGTKEQNEEAGRKWFQWYCARLASGVHQPPQIGVRYPCPCCGYPTLNERGGFDICELCNWEDDGQDDPHADEVWGGPNSYYSLAQARENFKRHWVMYTPDKQGRSDSPVQLDAKKSIVAAFDAMPMADDEERARLWSVVKAGEVTLEEELFRSVGEMEASAKES